MSQFDPLDLHQHPEFTEIVNNVAMRLGLAPYTGGEVQLDSDYGIIAQKLTSNIKSCLARGWWFNTIHDYELTPNDWVQETNSYRLPFKAIKASARRFQHQQPTNYRVNPTPIADELTLPVAGSSSIGSGSDSEGPFRSLSLLVQNISVDDVPDADLLVIETPSGTIRGQIRTLEAVPVQLGEDTIVNVSVTVRLTTEEDAWWVAHVTVGSNQPVIFTQNLGLSAVTIRDKEWVPPVRFYLDLTTRPEDEELPQTFWDYIETKTAAELAPVYGTGLDQEGLGRAWHELLSEHAASAATLNMIDNNLLNWQTTRRY